MADNLATQKKVLRIIIIININIIINKYIILPITLSINMQTHHQSGRQGGTCCLRKWIIQLDICNLRLYLPFFWKIAKPAGRFAKWTVMHQSLWSLGFRFDFPQIIHSTVYMLQLREDINENVFFQALREWGGGVYPCPNFLALFQEMYFWSMKRVYFFKNANVLNF